MSGGVGHTDKLTGQKKAVSLERQKASNEAGSRRSGSKSRAVDKYDAGKLIFSLDIGTRTVVGIVGLQENDCFRVVAAEVVEHKSRAMLDGQIHDIMKVAEVTKEVKEKLEKSVGVPLTRVAIAAAGRVLKTCEAKVEHDIDQSMEITEEMVGSLEIEAVQQAHIKLDDELAADEKTQFYCAGYSVISYYLNGFSISSLTGHRGKKAGAEILATFLPHIVVDSLYSVMNKVGLEVASLTLEPIAAINVTIPRDLRMLNLALVDIGAGTSDIAITRDGSVVAYAMAPVAGDEITESIARQYLVDFNSAEHIKISLSSGKDSVSFTDILGKKSVVKCSEVLEATEPVIELLSNTISQKILEYNHKSPNAVFLIGGGSQIPGLTNRIAALLKLPEERVVVRGRDFVQNVKFKGSKLSGPESITPLGIAVTSLMQNGHDFLNVYVNGRKVRLLNAKRLTVADALMLAEFNPEQLIGRTGRSISFTFNSVRKVVRGEAGSQAEIFVNDTPASLETDLEPGDSIQVIPAENGKNAEISTADLLSGMETAHIFLNGSEFEIPAKVYVNNKPVAGSCSMADGDIVEISHAIELAELLKLAGLEERGHTLLVNGQKADVRHIIAESDVVECVENDSDPVKVDRTEDSQIPCDASTLERQIDGTKAESNTDEPPAGSSLMSVTINGNTVQLADDKKQYIFVDVFNYINFDLSKPQGNVVLRLNGMPASFTDVIKQGDIIDIYWEK